MSEIKESILVVCSDDRSRELATILSPNRTVYRRRQSNGLWANSKWVENDWHGILAVNLPPVFDVLFFHTGANDPVGIPAGASFRKEFAFSGGGLDSKGMPAGRKDAIPIQRRFPPGGCPVKERHLPELNAFLEGERSEPPTFCRHGDTVPALWALAIACKAYAVAGIAHGAIKRDHLLVTELGWQGAEWETVAKVGRRLGDLWPRVQEKDWWRTHLGFSAKNGKTVDDAKWQEFLARLILDIELEVLAKTQFKLGETAQIADKPSNDLLEFIKTQTALTLGGGIVALLEAPTISTGIVAAAYNDLLALFARR